MMIVDLAVEDDVDVGSLVGDRLLASLYVDYAEAPHTESDARSDEMSLIVGTTMFDGAAHTRESCLRFVR